MTIIYIYILYIRMCRTHGNYLGGNNWSMRSEVKKTLRLKVGSVYHNLAVNVLTFKIHTVLQVFKLHESSSSFSSSTYVSFLRYNLLRFTIHLQTNSKI